MRRIVAILSIIAISSGLFVKTSLMVNYAVQYDKYNELCENKDRPELECHGSCKLSEEMSSASTSQSEPVLNNLTHFFVPMFYEPAELQLATMSEITRFQLYNPPVPVCCSFEDIDHPPELA